MSIKSLLAATVTATIALAGAAHADDYYAGKTISLIVPFSPGGPTDVAARSFAKFWEKNIPGNPSIIVKNVPGGGGMKGFRTVYEGSRPDGLTVYWGGWNPVGKVTGDPAFEGIEYDKVEYIGSAGAQSVHLIRTDAAGGIEEPADVMKGGFILGGTGSARLPDLRARLTLDLFGIDYKYVPGYQGGSKVYAALRQGEVDMMSTTLATFRSNYEPAIVEPGEAIALWYSPTFDADGTAHNDPAITDIPSVIDVYEQVKGEAPSGLQWDALAWLGFVTDKTSFFSFVPEGTPAEIVDVLRESYQKTKEEPEFKEQEIKQFGAASSFATIEEGEQIIQNYKNVDPEVLALLKKYVSSE